MTEPAAAFLDRHLGPRPADLESMLRTLGYPSVDALISALVPANIRLGRALDVPAACSESEALAELAARAGTDL